MRVVVCGNYGVGNIGDEAILEGLKNVLNKTYSKAYITVLGKGMHFPLGIRSLIRSVFQWKLWHKPYKAIRECDLFILGGGGLLTDAEGFFVPFFWAFHAFTALSSKKKVLCLGQSVGPLTTINAWMAKKLFQKASFVTVRDKASLELLKKWGIPAHMFSDFAFAIDYVPVKKRELNKHVIIIGREFKNINDGAYNILVRFLKWLSEDLTYKIAFIPFQNEQVNDKEFLNKILILAPELTSRIEVLDYSNVDTRKAIDELAKADAILSIRLHGGILASIAGTPFLPLYYMNKVRDFWRSFPEITPLAPGNLDLKEMKEAFLKLLQNSEKIRNQMAFFVEEQKALAMRHREIISHENAGNCPP
ncbi:polysaccharide pyruvyl transferase family protein [Candidatus Peregrinibacteria bacterium]|nr:polysaccharide pyruvyl transferase family protein [Candidatus Peregrinibacteria bacterium]